MNRCLTSVVLFFVLLLSQIGVGWTKEVQPGEPVEGLQLSITPEQTTWNLDEPKEFTAILKNVGDQPLVVDVFGEGNSYYELVRSPSSRVWKTDWEDHWTLFFENAQTGGPLLGPGFNEHGLREFSRDQFVLLKPGEMYERTLRFDIPHYKPGAGKFEMMVTHTGISVPGKKFARENFPSERIFEGNVISNNVTVEIVEPKASLGR